MKNLNYLFRAVAVGACVVLLAGCVGVLVLPGASVPLDSAVCVK